MLLKELNQRKLKKKNLRNNQRSKKKKHLPTHVDVFASESNGIKSDSTVLCEQLFTIDKSSILDSIGRVSEEVITKINKALCISLAL